MSQKAVTAIIHLLKKGRSANARYGQFLRPDKAPHAEATDLHLWLGRELSIQEFNEELPKAIRSLHGMEAVYGRILVREVEGAEGDLTAEEVEKLKQGFDADKGALELAHEEALAAQKAEQVENLKSVQAEVNDFTELHNGRVRTLEDTIADLRQQLEFRQAEIRAESAASQPNPGAEAAPEKNLSEERAAPSEVSLAPVVEAASPAAGEQTGDAAEPSFAVPATEGTPAPVADEAPQAKKKKHK